MIFSRQLNYNIILNYPSIILIDYWLVFFGSAACAETNLLPAESMETKSYI